MRVERPLLVLAHGLFGGRRISFSPVEYFRGIGQDLQSIGHEVLVTEVPPTASVSVRAEAFCEQLYQWAECEGRRVTVIAHSMGGLDVRYAISKLGADSWIHTLLTVSTPHRGSKIADAIMRSSDFVGFTRLLQAMPTRFFAELPDGGRCLTPETLDQFNASVVDSPKVRYFSVGGDRGCAMRTSPELMATYMWLLNQDGPNDGLVSVASSRWGTYVETLDMDHFHQINFPLPHRWISSAPSYNDVVSKYRRLAAVAREAEG